MQRVCCLRFVVDLDWRLLVDVALLCERFSPCVGLEEGDRPECLFLDITGVGTLFGGEDKLADQLSRLLADKGMAHRVGLADTVTGSWAVARFGWRSPTIAPSNQPEWFDPLPIESLRLSQFCVAKLKRLGIKTIRQLTQLDRSGLASRFGAEVGLRLAQLYGEREELIVPVRPAPRYFVDSFFEDPTHHPDAIERLWTNLLRRLLAQLAPKRQGPRKLGLQVFTDRPSRYEVTIGVCEPTAEFDHLAELIRLKLERLYLDAPVRGMRIEAFDVSPLGLLQEELFGNPSRPQTRQWSALLNRLSNRLGSQAVVQARLQPDPIPERSARLTPALEPNQPFTTVTHLRPLDRLLGLLAEPKPIEVVASADGLPSLIRWDAFAFAIVASWGPERIESGWWQGRMVRRDYYQIETNEGRRFWIFRRLQDQRWFLHGEAL